MSGVDRRFLQHYLIKRPDAQINYGTGKEVSGETIADAKEPLSIEWFNDSFVTIPVLTAR